MNDSRKDFSTGMSLIYPITSGECRIYVSVSFMYLLLKIDTIECDHRHQYCVTDQFRVGNYFRAVEGGNAIQEEGGCILNVPDHQAVDALVDLQTVFLLPIPALI